MAPPREEQELEYEPGPAPAARVESPVSETASIGGTLGVSESGPASIDVSSGPQTPIDVFVHLTSRQVDGNVDHEAIYSAIESTPPGVADSSSIYSTPTAARVPRDGSSQPNNLSESCSVAQINGLVQRNEPSPTSRIMTLRPRPRQQQRQDVERSDSFLSAPDSYIPRLLAGTSFRRGSTEAALLQTDGSSNHPLAVPSSTSKCNQLFFAKPSNA